RDCPSGQLSKKKFIEVYSGFFPDGNAEEFCTHVFRTFDKDNSGKIDFKEFLLAINITSGGKPQEKLEWAFQMYDIDGNGTIERNEMVEIIKAIYSMLGADESNVDITPEARTEEIFDKMDLNKDGVLCRDEFMKGCLADKQLYSMLLADEPADRLVSSVEEADGVGSQIGVDTAGQSGADVLNAFGQSCLVVPVQPVDHVTHVQAEEAELLPGVSGSSASLAVSEPALAHLPGLQAGQSGADVLNAFGQRLVLVAPVQPVDHSLNSLAVAGLGHRHVDGAASLRVQQDHGAAVVPELGAAGHGLSQAKQGGLAQRSTGGAVPAQALVAGSGRGRHQGGGNQEQCSGYGRHP
uniref:EF-hand domain-containing protein n=1 Tax=Macrostomum lignano TaxID=282301 RepID=A0A1I8HR93_9PLAT